MHVDKRRENLKAGLSSELDTFDPNGFVHLKSDLIKNFEAYDMVNRALIFGSKRDCVNLVLTWKDSITGEKKIS